MSVSAGSSGEASTLDPTPNNLPLQLNSFIGREQQITHISGLLKDNRLLTLTGPGGSGKTRLALAAASAFIPDTTGTAGDLAADGVWLVELAPLADPGFVIQETASVFGVRETPGVDLTDALASQLRYRDTLLVLDNCEHLVVACATLSATLLYRCPGLRILATSREALGVPGEVLFSVPPLSLPDPRRIPDVQSLSAYEAARLFLDRTVAVRADFSLDSSNAAAVAQVCYRLEGIPLAIELAAARMRVLSVEQILARLDDSISVLGGRERTAAPHHRTLRATMDWSYGLLYEPERALLRRLSVFAGGFTLEAAEAVGMGEYIEAVEEAGEPDILELLVSLVDKSLVLVDEHGDGVRYRVLETVRQYAREKLTEAGEYAEAGEGHAEYFLRLAEEAEPELKGHGQVAWLDVLDREHDNIRAAMRYFLDLGIARNAARLCWAIWFFWRVRGYQGEGNRYTGEALELEDALSTDERARLLCARGVVSYGLESMESSERFWKLGADLFRQIGDRSGQALALGGLALMALGQGELDRSATFFEEGLEQYRGAGNEWGVSSILSHRGLLPLIQGDLEGAARDFEEGLELSRRAGDRLVRSIALHNLAWVSQLQGDLGRAMQLYVEGLSVAEELGDRSGVAYCLEGIADLVPSGDQPGRKTRLYGASEAILKTVGAPLYVQMHDRELYARTVHELRSRMGDEGFEAAWTEGRVMTTRHAIDYALDYQVTLREHSLSPAEYPAGLSTREMDVLKLVARGMKNADIARELYVSSRTVNAHLGSIYNKIGSHSRAEATRFAVQHRLL